MTTNIEQLPLCKLSMGVGLDEDLSFSISFWSNTNTAIALTGIMFTVAIYNAGGLVLSSNTVANASGNTLTVLIPAATKVNWTAGYYGISILMTDGSYSKDLLASSFFNLDQAEPPQLSVINPQALMVPQPNWPTATLGLPV